MVLVLSEGPVWVDGTAPQRPTGSTNPSPGMMSEKRKAFSVLRGLSSDGVSLFHPWEEQVDRSVGLVVEQGMTEESGGGKLEMASCSTLKQSPLPMKETPLNYHPYPPPLARYEDVVACPRLFMDTLEKLHATMRTKFILNSSMSSPSSPIKLFEFGVAGVGVEEVLPTGQGTLPCSDCSKLCIFASMTLD
ncbi:unnamed protein product [Ilex paraguariensis]|uniref:Uncharacterized protein n=1 Tax=Ilex paraguariensis TaxID=185542 RepID=A0ABC8T7X4_9AQUA